MRICLSPSVSFEWLEGRRLLSSYFVSTTGSDTAAGTAAAPWKTLQKAANTVKAGDVVTVSAGDYAGFSVYSLKGTAAAPIKFIADGAVNIVSRATAQSAVNIGIELSGYDTSTGCSYIEIDGFNVNNASGTISGGLSAGFRVRFSDHITLKNCIAAHNGWVGFYTSRNNYLTIDSCESYDNNGFVDSGTARNHGIYIAQVSSNVIVRNCIVHDNNGNGIHNNGDGGVNTNILLEGNKVYNNGAIGGSAINCDGIQNSIIRNNLLYNNKNKGIALYNIDATDGSRNNIITSNTVIMASTARGAAIQIKDDGTGNKIYNNIFGSLSTNVGSVVDFYNSAWTGTVFDYNCYIGAATKPFSGDSSVQTWSDWRLNYPEFDAHSFTSTTAAVFVNAAANDYHLSATSPAIDKGTATNAPTTDQDLGARPAGNGYDMGAYEYGSSGGGGGGGTVTVPNAPTALSATAMAYNTINLAWTDNSTNETGFKIERRLGLNGTWAPLTTVGAGTTTYVDSTVAENSTYYYRVLATNSAGDSAYSNTDSALTPVAPALPAAPSGLAATAYAYNNIGVVWTDNSADETGFKIERRTGTTGTFAQVATVGANVTTWTDTTVTGDTTYYYRVRSTNTAGDSAYSNMDSALTPTTPTAPASPTGLALNAVSSTQVNLTWADNSNNETGFRIDRKVGTGSFVFLTNVAANATTYSDTTVSGGTAYSYRIRAYNDIGFSVWSNNPSVTTPAAPTVPAAPSGLTATAAGTSQVNLSWTDNSSNETGFKIEQQIAGGAWAQIATVNAGVTSYSATSLTASTLYGYRVRANNAQGDSGYSNTASATTASLPTVPGDPSNLAAEALSDTQIKLTWSDNSGNETGFRIERDDNGTFVQVGSVGSNVTTWTDTGRTAETQYSYRVVASNSVGDSGYSNTASATTTAAPTAPDAPSDLVATAAGMSQINLSWTDNSGNETGFKVERSLDGNTWNQVASLAAGTTSYQSQALSADTQYSFRVRATNAVGDSDYSNVASATTDVQTDSTAPTASATFSGINAAGDGTYTFSVTYTDDTDIDANTIDGPNIRVTGPNGFNQLAELLTVTGSGTSRVATYRIHAPGTGWQWSDDGKYTFSLEADQVSDGAGNFAAAGALGTMDVLVPSVDYAGDTKGSARSLGIYSLDKIGVYNDVVEVLDIQDWYKIKINSTMLLTCKIYNLTDDANLQLRALDGTLIQASGRSGTNYDYISKVLKPGTYYFRVLDNATIGTGYNMRVTTSVPPVAAPAVPDFAGDSRSGARSTGSWSSGRVSVYTDLVSATDQDYYKLDVTGTVTLAAKLTNLTGDINMELQDSAGNVLDVSNRTGTTYEYITRTLSAGTYYIRLFSAAGATSETTLRLAAA